MSKENTCGERIKLIRKTLKEKQVDFGKRLNISGASVSEIESGKYKPNYDFLINISKEYGVNLYYLLFGEGEMFTGTTSHPGPGGDFAVKDEEVRRFFWYFERSSMVQLLILGHFQGIMLKDQESIDKEVEAYKKRRGK
jgi:transcriptional regulator with XRE-family HTH domain